jgi:hypothetical protein
MQSPALSLRTASCNSATALKMTKEVCTIKARGTEFELCALAACSAGIRPKESLGPAFVNPPMDCRIIHSLHADPSHLKTSRLCCHAKGQKLGFMFACACTLSASFMRNAYMAGP